MNNSSLLLILDISHCKEEGNRSNADKEVFTMQENDSFTSVWYPYELSFLFIVSLLFSTRSGLKQDFATLIGQRPAAYHPERTILTSKASFLP